MLVACVALPSCNGDLQAYFAKDVVDLDEDLTYVDGSDNPRQRLDVYHPRDLTGYPVVVFAHGGYWTNQDKRYFEPLAGLYGNVGRALARRGIGVVIMNYRLVPDVTFDEQMNDILAATRWTKDHIAEYGGDPRRIVLAGYSSGGHVASLAAFQPGRLEGAGLSRSDIHGYALLSPIFDAEDMAAHPPEDGFDERVSRPVFGDRLKELSPRTHFKKDVAPLFVSVADADEPYLVTQIPRSVSELQALGASVTFVTLANHSHADVALNFDTDADRLTPALTDFVLRVAP